MLPVTACFAASILTHLQFISQLINNPPSPPSLHQGSGVHPQGQSVSVARQGIQDVEIPRHVPVPDFLLGKAVRAQEFHDR